MTLHAERRWPGRSQDASIVCERPSDHSSESYRITVESNRLLPAALRFFGRISDLNGATPLITPVNGAPTRRAENALTNASLARPVGKSLPHLNEPSLSEEPSRVRTTLNESADKTLESTVQALGTARILSVSVNHGLQPESLATRGGYDSVRDRKAH